MHKNALSCLRSANVLLELQKSVYILFEEFKQ